MPSDSRLWAVRSAWPETHVIEIVLVLLLVLLLVIVLVLEILWQIEDEDESEDEEDGIPVVSGQELRRKKRPAAGSRPAAGGFEIE